MGLFYYYSHFNNQKYGKNNLWCVHSLLHQVFSMFQFANAFNFFHFIFSNIWTGMSFSIIYNETSLSVISSGTPFSKSVVKRLSSSSVVKSSSSSPCRAASTDIPYPLSLSFIASGRSSGLHPVSSHSWCMYVLADCPALARPYVGVHRSTSLMSSSLLLQQCSACLARQIWIVFVMGGRWPYNWCFVGCCHQDLFNIARNILV